jgi:hypothetical protein
MILTKEILHDIAPGEIFKVVTTRLQNFHEPFKMTLKFICIKGHFDSLVNEPDAQDWAIYAGRPTQSDLEIAQNGDKVHDPRNITTICPCDEGVQQLYRH